MSVLPDFPIFHLLFYKCVTLCIMSQLSLLHHMVYTPSVTAGKLIIREE